jgi:hypothetical protein
MLEMDAGGRQTFNVDSARDSASVSARIRRMSAFDGGQTQGRAGMLEVDAGIQRMRGGQRGDSAYDVEIRRSRRSRWRSGVRGGGLA